MICQFKLRDKYCGWNDADNRFSHVSGRAWKTLIRSDSKWKTQHHPRIGGKRDDAEAKKNLCKFPPMLFTLSLCMAPHEWCLHFSCKHEKFTLALVTEWNGNAHGSELSTKKEATFSAHCIGLRNIGLIWIRYWSEERFLLFIGQQQRSLQRATHIQSQRRYTLCVTQTRPASSCSQSVCLSLSHSPLSFRPAISPVSPCRGI